MILEHEKFKEWLIEHFETSEQQANCEHPRANKGLTFDWSCSSCHTTYDQMRIRTYCSWVWNHAVKTFKGDSNTNVK